MVISLIVKTHYEALHGPSKNFGNFMLFAWITIIFISLSPIRLYKNKARQVLMPVLVPLFGNLAWSPQTNDDERFWQDLRICGLVNSYDGKMVMDFITGNMKGTNVTLAEMTLSRGSGKHRAIIFKGAAIDIRLQKPAPVRLILKPRTMLDLNLFSAADTPAEVNIPSPDFTRIFRAFSNDQVLARTLLTPDVVEQLTKLSLLFDSRRLGVSLRGDTLFLVAHGAGELAPESLFTSAYKLERVHNVGRQLYLLSCLIETIMKDWRLDAAAPQNALEKGF